MEWSDRLRGARAPEPYRPLVNILARFPDQPIRQHRDWVAEVVRQIDRVPALLRDKKRPPMEITLELVLSIDPETMAEWQAEYARLTRWPFRASTTYDLGPAGGDLRSVPLEGATSSTSSAGYRPGKWDDEPSLVPVKRVSPSANGGKVP